MERCFLNFGRNWGITERLLDGILLNHLRILALRMSVAHSEIRHDI
jgi:hypothetical protein